jgi:hypothetical protein
MIVKRVTARLVVAAPFAFADDADGGHCSYGVFSVNVSPSCDTSNGGGNTPELTDNVHDLPDTLPQTTAISVMPSAEWPGC